MSASTPTVNGTNEPISIAIIGAGIIGTVLALGLTRRKDAFPLPVNVRVYEQSATLRAPGAGIAFTANARKCLALIDPVLEECATAVGTANGEDPERPNNYMQFVDGYTHRQEDVEVGQDLVGKKVYRLHAGRRGFEGCHRQEFLRGVLEHLNDDVVVLGKRLEEYSVLEQEKGKKGKLQMMFSDGSSAEADIVIGTDGLKSRVRQLLFGVDNPVSYPHYTHKIAYRALIPMPLAISRLGKSLALNQHMYGGPNAHLLTFPVANQKLMNVVGFVSDTNEWPLERSMTQPARKDEIVDAFRCWGPTVREIIDLLGEVDSEWLDKWAVFDHFDHPAPYYASVVSGKDKGKGLVCVAGDAAHASSPHHGAGAGIGVEDALALITVIEKAIRDIHSEQRTKDDALTAALKAYSDVRYERSQWLVRSSREVCGTYEWSNPEIGGDLEKGFEDVKERSHRIWDFDIDGMLTDLGSIYQSC
ncbi:hypothetical protein AN3382.2 [Aspergillus nidulans FGSC A4]|uniref:FAD-binding domain-containing protein n=2 Tax=Emericella nidulans TaxID=162425 RepID=G5EAZ9_EMENI|nr:protein salA [Aspergillus nidulans FGSC A4]AAG33865.1 salicylate 1-monooxygenase [Aspergillus nidulans]EAA63350.1 hypothetical protein AN3382.2 [Aspergillus nidulans FGSC A4]CBF82819.1 TPA: Putative uncharacterized proteinSalicylate 1-monooxygenase; (EC 1.14.13.1) [Source:UniProtKB/TrEMBL;Acc:Q9HFQ8] [Aspergillus nidulans FGSC A4]|eukprot:XP_660986.1 hypothetical protein AN3382.2 [Aspergillus nidulans FGSC A4]